jgi:hypothetical protein
MLPRLLTGCLAVLLLAGIAAPAAAQLQGGSTIEITKNYEKQSGTIAKLKAGQTPTKADQEALDAAAKWLIYRFATSPHTDTDQEAMISLRKQFDVWINSCNIAEVVKNNRPFVHQLAPVMVQRYRDLFNLDFVDKRHSIINAAPTLLSAAKLQDDAICDYLAEIVSDQGDPAKNKHDAIKLYAIRALREFTPVHVVETGVVLDAKGEKMRARELRFVDALTTFVEKPAGKKGSDPEENAVRFLRREALETLAMGQAPTVEFGGGKVSAAIAPTFLRVLAPKGGLDPTPSLSERVEAAIGICQMKINRISDYQPEVGFYLVAQLTHDFGVAYNKDLALWRAAKDTRPHELHWRIHSKRLETAIKDMIVNTRGHPIAPKVKELDDAMTFVLRPMDKYEQVDQTQLGTFRTRIMPTFRPKDTTIFKGVKGATLDLGD